MKKTKKLMINIILSTIFLILIVNLIFFNIETPANASTTTIDLNTENFIYKNSNYNLTNYLTSLKAKDNILFNNNVTVDGKTIKAYGDDPIVKIIPKELFKKE